MKISERALKIEALVENGMRVGEAATKYGMSKTTYTRAIRVIRVARNITATEEIRKVGTEAVVYMDETGSINGAYTRVRDVSGLRAHKPPPITSATDQRVIIRNTVDVLDPMVYLIARIEELAPSIKPEETTAWIASLRKSRRQIEILLRKLRERESSEKQN